MTRATSRVPLRAPLGDEVYHAESVSCRPGGRPQVPVRTRSAQGIASDPPCLTPRLSRWFSYGFCVRAGTTWSIVIMRAGAAEHGSKNRAIVTPEVGDGLEEMGLLFKAEGNAPSLSGRSVDELCPNRVRLPDPIQISSRSCLINAEDRAAVAINEGRDAVIGDAVHVHRTVTRLV